MKIKKLLLIILLFISSAVFSQINKLDSIKSAGLTTGSVMQRKYRIYVPKYCIDNPSVAVPLIFNFHGTGSNAQQQQQMCGFDKIADTAHFIIVYPEGLVQSRSGNKTAWNALSSNVQDNKDTDLKFVDNLLDSVKAEYNINMCRVYATGMSIGGYMTYEVGFFLNNRFAAIASVCGIMLQNHFTSGKTSVSHVTPVMQVHGDNDGIVSYNGGTGQASVDTLINWWVNYDNCTKPATKTSLANSCSTDQCTVDNYSYPNGKNKSDVELYKVLNGGHYWPSNLFGCQSTSGSNNDYSASMEIWKFFRKYCIDDLKGSTPCALANVTTHPDNKTVCTGNNTTFGINATGTNLTYQWQVDQGSGFNNISNVLPYGSVTTATLTITGATSMLNGYKYQCRVTANCTPPPPMALIVSNPATLTIASTPTATISGNSTICSGTTSTINITVTGGTAPWSITLAKNGTNLAPFSVPSSPYTYTASTSGTYTISAVSDKNSCNGNASGSATVVDAPITVSNKTEVCNSGNADYTVEFDVTCSSGTYEVRDANGPTGTFTTSSHFISDPITSGTTYSLSVHDLFAGTSSPVIVTGTKSCSGGVSLCNTTADIYGDTTLCPGESTTISVDLSGTAPFSFIYAIDGNNQPSVTTSLTTYTFTSSSAGVYTVVSVNDNTNCTVAGKITGSATVTENTALSTSTPIKTCQPGTTDYVVEFDISGGDQASYDVMDAVGSTGTFTSPTHFKSDLIASGTTYTLTVDDNYSCSPLTLSDVQTCSTPTCTATATISGSKTICSGDAATISIALKGTPPWTVTYAKNGTNQLAVNSIMASTYTFSTTAAGSYTVTSVSDQSGCPGSASGTANIKNNSTIAYTNKTATCNGSNYVVDFDMAFGDPTSYSVTGGGGGTVTGSHFTSNPIPSGTPYSFNLSDKYACSPQSSVSGLSPTCTVTTTCNETASISGNKTVCSGASATFNMIISGTGPWFLTYAINGTNQSSIPVTSSPYSLSASTAGAYTLVSVSNSANCTFVKSGTATLNVNTPITTSNVTTACNNTYTGYVVDFDMAGGNPATYNVTGGSGTKTGNHFTSALINSGTSYSFNITDLYACGTPVNVSGPVKTCIVPGSCSATAIMTGGGKVCNGTNQTLSVALTGQAPWTFTITPGGMVIKNQQTSPYTLTTSVAGTYSVTAVTDANCTGTPSGNAVVESCIVRPGKPTGIEENSMVNEISIYPNPTTGVFNLEIKNSNMKELQVSIVDILGNEIYSFIEKSITTDYQKQINLTDVAGGIYYIKMNNGSDIKIKKLIVQ